MTKLFSAMALMEDKMHFVVGLGLGEYSDGITEPVKQHKDGIGRARNRRGLGYPRPGPRANHPPEILVLKNLKRPILFVSPIELLDVAGNAAVVLQPASLDSNASKSRFLPKPAMLLLFIEAQDLARTMLEELFEVDPEVIFEILHEKNALDLARTLVDCTKTMWDLPAARIKREFLRAFIEIREDLASIEPGPSS